MHVGDFVQFKVPEGVRSDQFAYGQINAIETYSDFNGTRTFVYVRWIDSDGKPDSEAIKHWAQELEPFTPKRA